jgi:hypothetical protein
MKKHHFWGLSLVFLLFFSCSAQVSGSLSADGSAQLSVASSLKPRITSLIRTFAAAGGQTDGTVIDGQVIAMSMTNAPGIASILLRNTAPAALEGTLVISNINDFLSAADGTGFINFEQESSGGRFEINITRENGPVVLGLLSPDITAYLEALMAPIASGEELTKLEYLDLVGSIFNRVISDEIASSRFRASVEFPGRITNVRGGTFSGRRADFDISLLDLLVLEEPLSYEVRWR